ncbi:HAD family hydrolase [Streptomyces sp. NPDC005355]|uniref:HAD family hydrolase n=1 Tax=unclassified Streptomyces TaxID=2593676 RepID=UPI0033BA37E6
MDREVVAAGPAPRAGIMTTGAGAGSEPGAPEPIELVMLDVGGPVYDDACYARALLRAVRELGGEVEEAAFHRVCEQHRREQRGSLRTRLAQRFVPGADRERLSALASRYWHHPPDALYPDVLPTLRALAGRYRIALVANQHPRVSEALHRDGVAAYVDVWALSGVVGAEKPDPAIFRHALAEAGVPAQRAAHVGNRLDNDVRAARAVGVRTVWVLRGEAPSAPTAEQLREADAAVSSLTELPGVLDALQRSGKRRAAVP